MIDTEAHIRTMDRAKESLEMLNEIRQHGRLRRITKRDISAFTFAEYRKVGTTKLSNETLPAGTKVETLEGDYTCAEPSRLAIDAAGNVYPVAESIFSKSYERAS